MKYVQEVLGKYGDRRVFYFKNIEKRLQKVERLIKSFLGKRI